MNNFKFMMSLFLLLFCLQADATPSFSHYTSQVEAFIKHLSHSVTEKWTSYVDSRSILLNTTIVQGIEAEANSDFSHSEILFATALQKNPSSKAALLGLTRTKIHLGKNSESRALLDLYRQKFGVDENFLRTATSYTVFADDAKQALIKIQPLLRKNPSDDALLDLQDYALARMGKLDEVLKSSKVVFEADLYNAELASVGSDYALAEQHYLQHIYKHHKDKSAWRELIRVEIIMDNYLIANRNLANYYHKFGSDDNYLLLRAYYLSALGHLQEANEIIQALSNKNPRLQELSQLQNYLKARQKLLHAGGRNV